MDQRPAMALFLNAMGTAITITRPPPNDTPVAATGIWVPAEPKLAMFGTYDERRGQGREPRRVLAIPRDVLNEIPRGTQIQAAELPGGTVRSWIADGYEHSEPDHHRVFVVPAA